MKINQNAVSMVDKQLSQRTNMKYMPINSQKGATLIVVLLLLVLIMLAGSIAVKRSATDLKTATSDQINTLLLQSADSANQKLESVIKNQPMAVDSGLGMFGYFMDKENPDRQQDEFVYCFDPKTDKYNIVGGYFLKPDGGKVGSGEACDASKTTSFVTGRNISMVQVSVAPSPVGTSGNEEDFGKTELGESISGVNSSISKTSFDIRSTSLIPSYNSPGDCLSKTSLKPILDKDKKVDTSGLMGCLVDKSVPSKTLFEQGVVERETTGIECKLYGNSGEGKDASKCKPATTP